MYRKCDIQVHISKAGADIIPHKQPRAKQVCPCGHPVGGGSLMVSSYTTSSAGWCVCVCCTCRIITVHNHPDRLRPTAGIKHLKIELPGKYASDWVCAYSCQPCRSQLVYLLTGICDYTDQGSGCTDWLDMPNTWRHVVAINLILVLQAVIDGPACTCINLMLFPCCC